MTQGAPIPKKMWLTPLPNPDDPWSGGAVLNVLTVNDEHLKVGLSLSGLLNLQLAVVKTLTIVLRSSVPVKEQGNPITEEEILAASKLLDSELEDLFNKKEKDNE